MNATEPMNVAGPPFSGPALDVMEEVFFAFTPEGRLVQWNQRLAEVTGYSGEEIAEMHPTGFVPAEERELIEKRIQETLEEGSTRVEAHFQTKEGELVPYAFTGTLFEREGETLICGTGRDISERKRAEKERRQAQKELEASEERYRRLFEDAQEGITISTPDGEIKAANPAAAKILGYSREELTALDAADVFFDPSERKKATEELEEKGALKEKELRLRRKDGTEVICEVSTTLRRGPEGEPDAYQNFLRDVTDRKEAEKALKASEERYRRLFEESRDAVVLTRPDGDVVDANGAAEELFGYSREELLSLNAAQLYADPEERTRRIVPELKEATSSRLLEAEMRHGKGHTFLASASVTVHRNEEGHPELIQALVRDVTHRRRREKELAEQKQRAERQKQKAERQKQEAERQKQEAERQKQRAERKNTLLRLMQRVASAANEARSFEEAVQVAVDAVCEQTGWPVGHVFRRAGEEKLEASGIWNRGSEGQFGAFKAATEKLSFARGEGLPGRVLESSEPAWSEDVTSESGFPQSEAAREAGVQGAFAFPVLLKGETQAVLEFYSEEAEAPSEEVLEVMETVGVQLGRVAERVEARRDLEASERRYRRLFEKAQEGIAITTPEGEVLDVNSAALDIFGYSQEEIRSINTKELYARPEERQAAVEEMQEKGAVEGREFRLYRANGEEFFCRLSATVLHGEEGKPVAFVTFFRDVTERKKAEEALKESEEMFRKLAENALVGIGLLQEGIYQYANPTLAEITGYAQEELLGKPLKRIIHPDDWPAVQKQVERREKGDVEQAHYEIRIQRKSGETRLVEVAGSLIDYQGKPAIIGTMQDITERRRLQREVLKVQEEERKRLGQDLHDGVASQLTGANILLSTLSAKTDDEETKEGIQEVQSIVEESAGDVRRLSRGLNPGGLSEGALPSALEQLVTNVEGGRYEEEAGREEEAELFSQDASSPEDASPLDEEVATHLYRIAQEAVANARKYAEANEIILRLREEEVPREEDVPREEGGAREDSADNGGREGSVLVLEVEDDGKGFDLSETGEEGLGLRSMRHRAELMGAELAVESSPEQGTLVRCRLST